MSEPQAWSGPRPPVTARSASPSRDRWMPTPHWPWEQAMGDLEVAGMYRCHPCMGSLALSAPVCMQGPPSDSKLHSSLWLLQHKTNRPLPILPPPSPATSAGPRTMLSEHNMGQPMEHNHALIAGSIAGLKHDTVSNARLFSAPELSLGVTPRTITLPRKVHRSATLHGPGATCHLAELRAPLQPMWLPCTGHSLDTHGPSTDSTALHGSCENLSAHGPKREMDRNMFPSRE